VAGLYDMVTAVRAAAADALGHVGGDYATAALIQFEHRERRRVRDGSPADAGNAAVDALVKLSYDNGYERARQARLPGRSDRVDCVDARIASVTGVERSVRSADNTRSRQSWGRFGTGAAEVTCLGLST
jgi:hypothetical protein